MKALLLLCGLLLAPAVQPGGDVPTAPRLARYRLLHACAGLGAVEVFFNGEALDKLPTYAQFTPYVTVRAGVENFKLMVKGQPKVLDNRDATFDAGQDYTIAIVGTPTAPAFLRLLDRRPIGDPRGHVRAVNLLSGTAPVEVRPEGDPPLARLACGEALRPLPVGPLPARYQFHLPGVTAPLAQTEPVAVSNGATLTLWLLGRAPGSGEEAPRVVEDRQVWPQPEVYDPQPGEPRRTPPPPPQTRLRVLQAMPGAPAVDGRLDDRPLVRNLAYGDVTEYVPVTAGHHSLVFTAGGQTVDDGEVDLRQGEAYTVFVAGEPGRSRPWLLLDEPGAGDTSLLRVVDAALGLGEVVVELAGQGPLVAHITDQRYTAYAPLPASGEQQVSLHRLGEDTRLKAAALTFAPGVNYTLVIIGTTAPELPNAAVSLRLLKDG